MNVIHRRGKNELPMHHVRIVDGEKLRSVLSDIAAKHGSQRRAAKWLGIQQSTFNRLLTGRTAAQMSFATYERICQAFGATAHPEGGYPEGVDDFPPYPTDVEAAKAAGLLEAYKKKSLDPDSDELDQARNRLWQERLADPFDEPACFHRFLESVLTVDGQDLLADHSRWMKQELDRLRTRAHPAFETLWAIPRERARLTQFFEEIGRGEGLPEEDDSRCWLAIYRALEPLTVANAGGIERTLEEVRSSDGELKEYLKAALRREEIVLRRERDLERAQRLAIPGSYFKTLGEWEAREHYFEDNPGATKADWDALPDDYGGGSGESKE